ncbi:MAG: hemerythrin domain-containing protein [Acidobacteria bacterium]|nr:hemerythrin domain-containing protein [Acidobacteriota bacterium]
MAKHEAEETKRNGSKKAAQPRAKRSSSAGQRKSTASTAHTHSNDAPPKAEQAASPKLKEAQQEDAPSTPTTGLDAAASAIGRTLGRTVAAVADKLPWKGSSDGLTLLEEDHRRLESLLAQTAETSEEDVDTRRALIGRIAEELTTHEMMEEKVLYPALKSHSEAKDIVLEGYQEHHVADLVMKELQELPPSDERWGAKLKVLKENLEHHIEEEEGDMFKTARSILSPQQLEEIGAKMQAMKERVDREPRERT